MKVPPKRKGNNNPDGHQFQQAQPSMKVPPKRKGNVTREFEKDGVRRSLNESPSEKEGK